MGRDKLGEIARIIFSAFYDDERTEADFNDPRYVHTRIVAERAAAAVLAKIEAA